MFKNFIELQLGDIFFLFWVKFSMSTPAARSILEAAARGTVSIRRFMSSNTDSVDRISEAASKTGNLLPQRGNTVAREGIAVIAGSVAPQICSNCKERRVESGWRKCGYVDWCSACDDSLWSSNPEVVCTGTSHVANIATPVLCSTLSSAAPCKVRAALFFVHYSF